MRWYVLAALFAALVLVGCEGSRNNTSWSKKKAGTEIVPPLKTAQVKTDSTAAADSGSAGSSQVKH
jgi:hypothetical protein